MDDATREFFSNGNHDVYQDMDLERCLDVLPEKFRTVIVLRYSSTTFQYDIIDKKEQVLLTLPFYLTIKTTLKPLAKILKTK